MKKLLPYLLFTGLIPVALAAVFYLRYISSTNDIDPNMHYLTTPNTEQNDILFIGNSHIFYQIDPRVIEAVTGLKAYNLGLEGVGMAYYSMVYHIYMQRHPLPKYFPDYIPYLRDTAVSASLAPYYPEYRSRLYEIYYSLKRINSRPDPSKVSNLYRIFTPAAGAAAPLTDSMRGFHPWAVRWKDRKHDIKEFHSTYSGPGIDMLREMIQDAGHRGIKVILIAAPMYKDYRQVILDYDHVLDTARTIAAGAHIPLWDYADIPMSRDSLNYYSIEHLNARGAHIYSELLGEDIKKYIGP
jgi:hypothetical protein